MKPAAQLGDNDSEGETVLGGGGAIGVSLGGGTASSRRAALAVQRTLFARITGGVQKVPEFMPLYPGETFGESGGGGGDGGGGGEGDGGGDF